MPCRWSTRILLAAGLLSPLPEGLAQTSAPQAPAGPPPRPTVCTIVSALLRTADGGPSSERDFDTSRLQDALNRCPAGQAVELSRSADQNLDAFLTAPIDLPPEVSLWIDAGVTLFASRNPADYGHRSQTSQTIRPLLNVLPGDPGSNAGMLAGYGTVDARGRATLLTPEVAPGSTWIAIPRDSRPDLLRLQSAFTVSGVTLRAAAGVAIRIDGKSPVVLEDVTIANNPADPEATAIQLKSGTARLIDSAVAGSVETAVAAITLVHTGIYSGHFLGYTRSGPCLANTDPAPACLPAALPSMLGRLIQTGPTQMAAVFAVPDTRLPLPSGMVELMDGEQVVGSAPISGSAAFLEVGGLNPGAHRLHARLTSAGLDFGDLSLTVLRSKPADASSTLTLTSSATTIPYGTSITLTAALPSATGVVTFLDGSILLGQATMSNGTAFFTLSTLALGPHTVTALYAGDTVNPIQQSPSLTLQVNPITTRVSLGSLPSTIVYGTALNLAATVLPANATGRISFYDAGLALGTATLAGGTASQTATSLPPGTHTFTAAYSGDTYDLPATSPAVQVVITPASTSTTLAATPASATFGDSISLQIAVSPDDASGTVTVMDGVSVIARTTLASGLSSAAMSGLAPGLHLLTAAYAGDTLHSASSSSTAAVQVARRTTITLLAPVPASIAADTPVTLLATVQPASATGTITWLDRNSGVLGQASLSSGTATLNLLSLATGSHAFSASYSGDTEDAPSTSAAQTTNVPLGSTGLTLSGISASLAYSAPAILLASLTPSSAGGSVTVTDVPSGALGTILLHAGTGSLALPALLPGDHILQASYGGDPAFSPAAASLSLHITPDPTSTTITSAQAAVPAGSPVLLNVRVSTPYPNAPTGPITVRINPGGQVVSLPLGNPLPGQSFATLSLNSAGLGLGSFTALAAYAGDANDLASQSDTVSFSVVPTPTSLNLTLPVPTIPSGTPSTVTASVTSPTTTPTAIPTGTIVFFRDGAQIATLPVAAGAATAQLPALSPGVYVLSASFQPSGLFGPAVAPLQVLTVTLPITFTLTPSVFTMKPGADATSALSILPLSGFTGTYSASCSSPTVYVSCSIDPATGPVPAAATLHVHIAPNTYTQAGIHLSGQALALALLFPGILLIRRRKHRAGALLLTLGLIAGCGKGTFFDVPPGTYILTVSVTAGGSTLDAPVKVTIAN